MANPNFDRDKASKIVLDASLMGDRAAADKWGVSERTVRHYRHKLDSDPEFAEVCQEKKRIQDEAWADEIPSMLAAGITFLKEAAQQGDREDPDFVHAIAGAIKIVSEVHQVRRVIDARLSGEDRPIDQEA